MTHTHEQWHPECDICWDRAVDAYATECLDIARDYGKNDDTLANLLSFVVSLCRFDRCENGRTGLSMHDEPVYIVAAFLGLKYQGDGLHTVSSRAFHRLDKLATPYRVQRLARFVQSASHESVP